METKWFSRFETIDVRPMQKSILFLLISLCWMVSSYNILGVFPTIAQSHNQIAVALMRGLAADGHNVTVISPFQEKNRPANYHEIHLDGIYDENFLCEFIPITRLHIAFLF